MWYESIFDVLSGYPTIIIIALVVIVLSILTTVFVYLDILFSRLRAEQVKDRTDKDRKFVSDNINNYSLMIGGIGTAARDGARGVVTELRKIKDVIGRKVLMDQIMYLSRNFSRNTYNKMHGLYRKLGLKRTSQNKLKDSAWEKKAAGIRELREMNVTTTPQEILQYVHSPNDDLRIEAQAAYIRLNKENPFGFLDEATEFMPEWHQIILFDEINRYDNIQIPSFKQWLSSDNIGVVLFSIKMIVHYKQKDAFPELVKLLSSEEEKVQRRAISALGNLDADMAQAHLYEYYSDYSVHGKAEAMIAFSKVTQPEYRDFLRSEFVNGEDYMIRKNAFCALAKSTKGTRDELLGKLNNLDNQQNRIVNYCYVNNYNA